MERLLDESEFINDFDGDERLEALKTCKDKYEKIYESYANTTEPTMELMDKVIDMYLFLGIEPSAKLMEDLKDYLLKGITFSKLDIYMHMGEYESIVKLLRPGYHGMIKDLRIFTISETIYNIASSRYTIEDDYKNAYSIWYIEKLKAKGLDVEDHDLYYLLEYGPWSCARYILDAGYILSTNETYDTDIAMEVVIRSNNLVGFKYLLRTEGLSEYTSEYLMQYDRIEMINHMGPLMGVDIWTDNDIVNNKDMTALMHMKKICPTNIPQMMTPIIRADWKEGFSYIIGDVNIQMHHLCDAHVYNRSMLKMLYDKLVKTKDPRTVLYNAVLYTLDFAKTIYEYNPMDLNGNIDLGLCESIEVVDFCISKGYRITDYDISISITMGYYYVSIYLIEKYGMIKPSFIVDAIRKNDKYIVEYLINHGATWDEAYPGIALKAGLRDMGLWLIDKGCPIKADDVHLI